MRPLDWHALVAVILALGVSTAIIVLSINELTSAGHVSQEGATLLATVLGAAIGAIATYLGVTRSSSGGGRPEVESPEPGKDEP